MFAGNQILQKVTTEETITGDVFKLNTKWFSDLDATIASVHTLPNNPVSYSTSRAEKRYNGLFSYDTSDPNGDKIFVSIFAQTPHLTFAHEMGHRVEVRALPELQGLFDVNKPDTFMAGWFQAVVNSSAIQKMRSMYQRGNGAKDDDIKYYLIPAELWARTYAQYIAVKSKHPAMLDELGEIQFHYRYRPGTPSPQWEEGAFQI